MLKLTIKANIVCGVIGHWCCIARKHFCWGHQKCEIQKLPEEKELVTSSDKHRAYFSVFSQVLPCVTFKSRLVEHLDDNSSHCWRGSWGACEVQLLCRSAHQGLCFFVYLPVSKSVGDTTTVSSRTAYKKRGADLFLYLFLTISLQKLGGFPLK